jgi:hypothetical protein
MANRMAGRRQFPGEYPGALARPPERRLRVASAQRLDRASSCSITPGSLTSTRGRPAPGRRTRPAGSGGSSSSRRPAGRPGRPIRIRCSARGAPGRPGEALSGARIGAQRAGELLGGDHHVQQLLRVRDGEGRPVEELGELQAAFLDRRRGRTRRRARQLRHRGLPGAPQDRGPGLPHALRGSLVDGHPVARPSARGPGETRRADRGGEVWGVHHDRAAHGDAQAAAQDERRSKSALPDGVLSRPELYAERWRSAGNRSSAIPFRPSTCPPS